MKRMTCKQLGGACNKVFEAATFAEMAMQSKAHGTKMYDQKDEAHLEAMRSMQVLMQEPEALQKWFQEKEKLFNSLPNI